MKCFNTACPFLEDENVCFNEWYRSCDDFIPSSDSEGDSRPEDGVGSNAWLGGDAADTEQKEQGAIAPLGGVNTPPNATGERPETRSEDA